MKKFFLCSLLISMSAPAYPQSKGYVVVGDSIYKEGKILSDADNPSKVTLKVGVKQTITYTAEEVSEYGYGKNQTFFSKQLDYRGTREAVFLEQKEKGNLELFILHTEKKKYFLKPDTLIPLADENYQELLKNYCTDCARWEDQLSYTRLKEKPIAFIVRNFNRGSCFNIPLTHFGLVVGYLVSRINLPQGSYQQNKFGEYSIGSSNPTGGVFINTPLWGVNKLSIAADLLVEKQVYYKEQLSDGVDEDISIELSGARSFLGLHYTSNARKVRPYFLAGADLNYTFHSNSKLFQAIKAENEILQNFFAEVIDFPPYYFGFTVGGGISFYYNSAHHISLELRRTRQSSRPGILLDSYAFVIKINR